MPETAAARPRVAIVFDEKDVAWAERIAGDLIRVGLSPWERQLFLSHAEGFADYRAVLLLLAVDTGAPLIAAKFFDTMRGVVSGEIRVSFHTGRA